MNKRAAIPLALVAGALIALTLTPAQTPLFGLEHGAFARAAAGTALMLALVMAAVSRARPGDFSRAVGAAATWALLIVALTGVYAYRFELSDVAGRIGAEWLPGEPQVGQGGEVIVNRRLGGEFVVAARVDGAKVSFLFDTGASTVVLTAEDAAHIGLDETGLEYDVPVTTANGAALAAATRLERVAVGPIVMRNVRALVARPGALSQSLLGMSYLERLQSYAVERGRLVLKAR